MNIISSIFLISFLHIPLLLPCFPTRNPILANRRAGERTNERISEYTDSQTQQPDSIVNRKTVDEVPQNRIHH